MTTATDYFYAEFKDGSVWRLPVDAVYHDMEKFEKSGGEDDKWDRPLTREMAVDWFGDNCDAIEGWEIHKAPDLTVPDFGLLAKIETGKKESAEGRDMIADAFVPVLDGRVLANAVASSGREVSTNLGCIELTDEEATRVEVMPCKIVVGTREG